MAIQTLSISYEGTTVGVKVLDAVTNGPWGAEFAASGLSAKDFVKTKLIEYLKNYVVSYEADAAQKAAYDSTLATSEAEVVLS